MSNFLFEDRYTDPWDDADYFDPSSFDNEWDFPTGGFDDGCGDVDPWDDAAYSDPFPHTLDSELDWRNFEPDRLFQKIPHKIFRKGDDVTRREHFQGPGKDRRTPK